jgi:hypothetical protein
MDMNATLGTCMASRIGSPLSVVQPSSPTSATPRSPRSSQHSPPSIFCPSPPAVDTFLNSDFSFGASLSPSPRSNNTRHRNLQVQVGAFYNDHCCGSGATGGGASNSSTCERETEHHREQQERPNPTGPISKKDYYEVLGVERDATLKEIRAAYRSKALEFHPDLAGPEEKDVFTELFAQMNEAYGVLTDATSREEYDAKISYFKFKSPPPHVPGFNSYSYNFTGFKTDIWARNAGIKTEGVSERETSSPRASSISNSSPVSTTNAISSGWRGRNWETDQCWC